MTPNNSKALPTLNPKILDENLAAIRESWSASSLDSSSQEAEELQPRDVVSASPEDTEGLCCAVGRLKSHLCDWTPRVASELSLWHTLHM